MLRVAEFVGLLCTALFAGAALYVNVAEHPARMGCDTRVALTVWAPSYARATLMQAPLAIVGLLAGCMAWWVGGGIVWLIAGLLLGAVVPITLIVIMPTNQALLDRQRDPSSPEIRALLVRWGRLHGVRTALSVVALVLLAWRAARP
jgi:uncharacterized membrane protein